jgi:hypothetical protein
MANLIINAKATVVLNSSGETSTTGENIQKGCYGIIDAPDSNGMSGTFDLKTASDFTLLADVLANIEQDADWNVDIILRASSGKLIQLSLGK